MIRLHIIAEGPTEERFVNSVLAPWLANYNVFCDARCIETSRDKRKSKIYRGGFLKYAHLKKDLTLWMKQDNNSDAWFTTMVDLYALPEDFPNSELANVIKNPFELIRALEKTFAEDVSNSRFIPYIQLHEYEALVLSEPSVLELFFPDCKNAIESLLNEIGHYHSPEEINQGESTAPSKRIISKIAQYEDQKAVIGPVLAEKIGIEVLRNKCKHFNEWLTCLENLDSKNGKPLV